MVHVVLKYWLCHISAACDASLGNKQSREQWEQSFYQTCAFPVLKSVQDDLKNTLDLIANDDSQGN